MRPNILKLRYKSQLTGAILSTAIMVQPAAAQRGYGGYIVFEEGVGEEEQANKPAETKPEIGAEEKKRREEEAKRKAEEAQREREKRHEQLRLNALDDIYPFQDKKLQRLTSPQLETFSGDRQLVRWLERLEKVRDDTDEDWISFADPPKLPGKQSILIAANFQETEGSDVCTNPEDCPDEEADQVIVTTARKATAPNITNVQSAGVDEGDIVKQIGDYLITLQDGRLFTVNIKTMQLTDRADVYRKDEDGEPTGASWYDEMLVQDDHILITAYDYVEEATELSIFSLDQSTGKVSADGVFLISSDDYYDVSNYASRIIGNKLILYAPYEVDPDNIDFEDEGWKKPDIRRWLPTGMREGEQKKGKPLFGGRDIYKPVLATNAPTIHTISVCPLGGYRPGKNLNCRTTGFLGPAAALMYVNANNIYLWNSLMDEVEGNYWLDDCTDQELAIYPRNKDVVQGALYKISVRRGDVGVVGVTGGLFDQYSLDEYRGRIRALSPRQNIKCAGNYDDEDGWINHVALLDLPLSRFDTSFSPALQSAYAQIPAPAKGGTVQNRFNGNWLTYGGEGEYWGIPDDEDELASAANNFVVTVPVRSPRMAKKVELGHSVERLELVGNDIVINGYRDGKGLTVSFLKMNDQPRISDNILLKSRYETENRSHAFNSITGDDGASIMGIPTSFNEDDSNRYWWWSGRSDLSFLTVTPDGQLADAGALIGKKEDESEVAEGYECEVSCIDWYGNARPIFADERIFGLMDTSLIEAEIAGGRINEKARIDMTGPIGEHPSSDKDGGQASH